MRFGGSSPALYNRYLSDQRVAVAVVDELIGKPEHDFVPPELSFAELVARLGARAEDDGPWLIATPLANLQAAASYTRLSDSAGLIEPIQDPDCQQADDVERSAVDELKRHLQDRLHPRARWLRTSKVFTTPLDTRIGASLVSVARGTRAVALAAAHTQARYTLAVWTREVG